jgi:hypothetical protein
MNQCGDKIALIAVDPNWSVTTRQYASYLNASILFYNANYSAATKIYTVLSTVEDTWLKETALYMLIRTSLNSAYTTGVDQYGDVYLDNINQNLLKQFLDHITVYLKAYPNGCIFTVNDGSYYLFGNSGRRLYGQCYSGTTSFSGFF